MLKLCILAVIYESYVFMASKGKRGTAIKAKVWSRIKAFQFVASIKFLESCNK